ncbi:hypothetical protein JAAARDRAFT_406093 [Jaapia argillacea MUCL 33604]|uniref:Uncharacterized protein n=1 Tax=Jaapia argillacea MUCL 33604 TaxID=933084 RepID=A0A067PVK2_9AGAM|nr:hypothetical protein JAAARDRAFT_406093 [Jaapia argillacea MUCL 33604]
MRRVSIGRTRVDGRNLQIALHVHPICHHTELQDVKHHLNARRTTLNSSETTLQSCCHAIQWLRTSLPASRRLLRQGQILSMGLDKGGMASSAFLGAPRVALQSRWPMLPNVKDSERRGPGVDQQCLSNFDHSVDLADLSQPFAFSRHPALV